MSLPITAFPIQTIPLAGNAVTSVSTGAGLTGGPITGDGTISLDTSGVTPGSYGTSSNIPVLAVDDKGRITFATTTPINYQGASFQQLTWAANVAILFNKTFQAITIAGDTTFTSSALKVTAQTWVRIDGDASDPYNLIFPGGWTFVGGARPTAIAAGKTALLSLISFTTGDTGVIAIYAVEP
jgi:hypothetical protein